MLIFQCHLYALGCNGSLDMANQGHNIHVWLRHFAGRSSLTPRRWARLHITTLYPCSWQHTRTCKRWLRHEDIIVRFTPKFVPRFLRTNEQATCSGMFETLSATREPENAVSLPLRGNVRALALAQHGTDYASFVAWAWYSAVWHKVFGLMVGGRVHVSITRRQIPLGQSRPRVQLTNV